MKMLLNGKLMDEADAVLPVLDHGVLYGVGAFETLRSYGGIPFLLKDHTDRLQEACDRLKMTMPFSYFEWLGKIATLLEVNQLSDALMRISITGGVKEIGLVDTRYDSPNVLLFVRPLSKVNQGKKITIVTIPRQAPGGVEMLKSNNYLNHIMARHEVSDYPHTEGLFLTLEGYLAEGITSNLFFVKGGEIFTPALELGILPGITRKFILMLAQKKGYTVHEGRYSIEELKEAQEIFLTNSVQGIIPVTEWEGQCIATEFPVTTELSKDYMTHTMYITSLREIAQRR